jgi:hypothetical protein
MSMINKSLVIGLVIGVAVAAGAQGEAAAIAPSTHADSFGEQVKRDAKAVGAACKEAAHRVGVAAKAVAHEIATAAKRGAAETRTAMRGENADSSSTSPKR